MSEAGESNKYQPEAEAASNGGVYDWVSDTARENPALVVGGALAVGALAAMVLLSRKPESHARTVEKRIGRELRSMERMISRQRPISTMSDRLAEASASLASTLNALDAGTLRDLVRRAGRWSSDIARYRG